MEEHTPSKLHGTTVGQGIRSSAFWILLATLFLRSVSVNGAITHLSPLLTDRGISAGTAALAASVLGFASFCGRFLTGFLLDRFFGPRVGFVLLATMAAGILLLALGTSPMTGVAAAAMIGFGMGARQTRPISSRATSACALSPPSTALHGPSTPSPEQSDPSSWGELSTPPVPTLRC